MQNAMHGMQNTSQVSSLSDAQKSFEEKLEKLPVSPSLPQTEVLVSRAAFRTHPSIIEKNQA